MDSLVQHVGAVRPIINRTSGQTHGSITRLMSPGDLGGLLKPFVFLDLFDNQGRAFSGFGLHPHSGIATLTWLAEGSVGYEDTTGARGVLPAGGTEWMQAGSGVWHGGGAGKPGRARGFQLWIALPPHLELGPPVSLYQGVDDVPVAGAARVLLGSHEGARSAIEAPSDINYLAVRLAAGERWRYAPPSGHDVLWIAVGKGAVVAPDRIGQGELAIFAPGGGAVEFLAETDAEFMLGSAVPHPHDLVLGYYSVHTSADALVRGERRIDEIRAELVRQGRLGRWNGMG
ncbi:MAG: pirin family protein [Rhodospirillales bacterium]|nr:pirin family protein [Rhodospirillales bacterium]